MHTKINKALDTVLRNWKSMSGAGTNEEESTADQFESSFYSFIDALREWVDGLEQRPNSLDELLDLSMVKEIVDRLPAPLHLNFETEAELIVENKRRIDEDKYD
jgi:hypothetical protein